MSFLSEWWIFHEVVIGLLIFRKHCLRINSLISKLGENKKQFFFTVILTLSTKQFIKRVMFWSVTSADSFIKMYWASGPAGYWTPTESQSNMTVSVLKDLTGLYFQRPAVELNPKLTVGELMWTVMDFMAIREQSFPKFFMNSQDYLLYNALSPFKWADFWFLSPCAVEEK